MPDQTLAVGSRVTVKATGKEGTIARFNDSGLEDWQICQIEFRDGSQDWVYSWNIESGWRSEAKQPELAIGSVEPLSYAIVCPPKHYPQYADIKQGKVVARVGSHTPVLAPFVCVKLVSDAPNRIGDTLDFEVDADKGAIEVPREESEASAALKRSRDIEAAAVKVVEQYSQWLDSKYEYTSALFAACRALRETITKGKP